MVEDVQVASGVQALGLVAAPAVVTLLTAAGFWLLRRSLRRQAVAERASLDADAGALQPGWVSLAGTVEVLDGETDPAPLKVVRDGEKWRVQEARPFLLRLANGVRVRVQPGPRASLRDGLDEEGKRAELTVGEQVFVRGVLRGRISAAPNAERALLVSSWWRPMRLSTEAFSGALEERARALDFQVAMLLLTAVGSQLFYVGYYAELLFSSQPATIVIAIYFWVALVAFSVVMGALLSGLRSASPGEPSRRPLG